VSVWKRLVSLYDWIQRVLPALSLIAGPLAGVAYAAFAFMKGTPVVYVMPLTLVVGLSAMGICVLGLRLFDRLQPRPLRVSFDPRNPNQRFWRDSRREYDRATDGYAYGWEYFVEVVNVGQNTLRGIGVTCFDRDSLSYRAAEGGAGLDLDPGQRTSVLLFFVSGDYEDEDGTMHDPARWRVVVRATAKDCVPSRALKLTLEPAPHGWEDEFGPYKPKLK